MGSVGSLKTAPVKTRTQRLVDRISQEVEDWLEDSWLDEEDKKGIDSWHDLLEGVDLSSSEAKEYILEALDSDVWDKINRHQDASEAIELQFDEDGEFEDENGQFLKYGQVMKLVKQELVNRGILKKPY